MNSTIPTNQILTLMLALSGALNMALGAWITARHQGATSSQAIFTAAGAAGTLLMIFFTGVAAYH
jgi:site-specific recombinase